MSITTPSLIESLLLHDRPAAWWGLDTADPLADDAVFGTSQAGYTLTALGTPSNSASLHTRGDTGSSGCRDFNGTTQGYFCAGTVTEIAEGPPAFHGGTSGTASSATATVVSPGGVQVGDLLLIISAHPTAGATVTTPPSGFTIVGTALNCTTHTKVIYRKTAVQADTVPQEYSVVWNSSAGVAIVMLAYRGCDPDVANLVFDSGEQVTASDTFHSTTSETFPDQARQLVIWTRDVANVLQPFPTGVNTRTGTANGTLAIHTFDYEQETAGSGARTCTTQGATNLGATIITFGSPRKVLNDVLDTITGNMSICALINPDTVAAGSRTIVYKQGAWILQVDGATLKFFYHDGTAFRSHSASPTLSAGTTYRVWATDDGSNITFYINGTKSTVARFNALPYVTNANRVSIAHFWNGAAASEFFDGRIDELAIFPAALSQQMIQAHEQAATQGTFGQYVTADKSGRFPRAKLELARDSDATDRCYAFTDVTSDVRAEGLQWQRMRNDPLDRMQAGTMGFTLDNRDTTYDGIDPRRPVRWRAQVSTDGPVIARFFGYTEAPSYHRPSGGHDSTVAFTATDPFKALSLNKVRESFVRPNEMPGVRLEALLATVGGLQWDLDEGHHEIGGADLQGVAILEHAQAVAESDGGNFFCDALGRAVFQDNQHRAINSGTVQAAYGWQNTSAPFPVKFFEPEVDESRLYTAAAVTPASGTVQRASNDIASARYYEITRELTTLHSVDADSLAMAHNIVNRYSVPLERVRELVLQPAELQTPATMWTTLLGHVLSQRVKTIEKPIGASVETSREHFIEGIAETVSVNDWQVVLTLSPVELEGAYFVIGTDEIGDTSRVIGW